MIVREFLQWARSAPETARAQAVAALARAYLRPDLGAQERAEMDAALPEIACDPSPQVRFELANALSRHPLVPADLVVQLAALEGEAGEVVLAHSPVLNTRELIRFCETREASRQVAIASREALPAPVVAVLAEVGSAPVCLALAGNQRADIPGFALGRIVARFGHVPEIRESLLARPNLPPAAHQALIRLVAGTLSAFVEERRWMAPGDVARVAREACEHETIVHAGRGSTDKVRELVETLQAQGQLTSALVLRSLLCGQVRVFLEAVSVLSGIPLDRVSALAADRSGGAFRMLYDRVGLPSGAYLAFTTALEAVQGEPYLDEQSEEEGLRQRILQQVITRYELEGETVESNRILSLLHRWRDETRDMGRVMAA